MERYVVLKKAVGETPLAALLRYKAANPRLQDAPMAYAGRLDPMASGKLLVLIGDECKRQRAYHGLDKEYRIEVLFGVGSDTGDVLGLLSFGDYAPKVERAPLSRVVRNLSGNQVSFPYPSFSSKTVRGKPLHVWTLEGRLGEIEVPVNTTRIHKLRCTGVETKSSKDIAREVLKKIETIPKVTEESKRLGADFRRKDVRAAWQHFLEAFPDETFTLATFDCIASSGTYMRSLAADIGAKLNVPALAYSIERTRIGRYRRLPFGFGVWLKEF